MNRVRSQRVYHSHPRTEKNGRRLLISGGRQWDEGLAGLALTVSYYSVDWTLNVQILHLYQRSLEVLCKLLGCIEDSLGFRCPLESNNDRGGGRLGGIASSWATERVGPATIYSGCGVDTDLRYYNVEIFGNLVSTEAVIVIGLMTRIVLILQ